MTMRLFGAALAAALALPAAAAPEFHPLRADYRKPVAAAKAGEDEIRGPGFVARRPPFQSTLEATLLRDGRIDIQCGQSAEAGPDLRFRNRADAGEEMHR
jgi:hypothetical protein